MFRAVARVLKRGFDQIFSVGALLDPSKIQLGGLGERCKLTNLVHFRLKMKHLVLYISLLSEII